MNAAVAQERWQGQIIDEKFPLLEWVGGSANTAVFRTQLPGSTQSAAIKLVRADTVNAAQQLSTWKQLISLSHPNLLRMFHAGHCRLNAAQWVYCVVEYAEENLEQVLPARALNSSEVADLLPPVLAALAFVHRQGFVYSGLKPSNIFAVKNQLKLAIEPLQPAGHARDSRTGAYDAPERGPFTEAADLWSLGMTIVSVFDQRPLTWGRESGVVPPLPKSIPAPYRLIAGECLRVDPAERCSLQRIREVLSPQAPEVPKSTAKRLNKKENLVVPLAALVVIGVIITLASRYLPSRTPAASAPTENAQLASPTPTTSDAGSERSQPQVHATAGGISERVLPDVPRSARQTIHGKVRVKVRLTVDPSGKVSSAVLSSPGPSKYFARLALEASRKWRFAAAETNGEAAPTEWMLEYKFGRSSTEVVPTQLH
jgi:TonB family protein